jgi:hypothetical protein
VLHEQLDPQLYNPRFASPSQQHPLTQHTEPGKVDSVLQQRFSALTQHTEPGKSVLQQRYSTLTQPRHSRTPKDYMKFLDEEEGSKEDLSYNQWEQSRVTSQKPVGGVSHPVMGSRPGVLGAQRTALKGK